MLAIFISDGPERGAIQPACMRSDTFNGPFGLRPYAGRRHRWAHCSRARDSSATKHDTPKHGQIGHCVVWPPNAHNAIGWLRTQCGAPHVLLCGPLLWTKLAVDRQRDGVVELVQYDLRLSTETLISQEDHIGDGSSRDIGLGSLG